MDLELHQLDLRYAALRRRDERRERQLLASLSERGQLSPIVVVKEPAGGFVLVDGYKRVRALARLSRDVATATAWELSEVEALLLARLMRTAEGDSALEQGWLLRELRDRFALSCGELARRFDKSESWVSRRLALVGELPETIQDFVRRGDLAAHAAMKHLVPLARAKKPGWEALVAVLAAHRLSSRQVGTLTCAWVRATEQGRKLVLSDPHLVLRADEQSRTAKEQGPGQRLLAELATVAAISRRARHIAEEERARAARSSFTAKLGRANAAARADADALFAVIEEEVARAG